MEEKKICINCKEEKNLNQFSFQNKKNNKYKIYCKSCASVFFKNWANNNKNIRKKYLKKYAQTNKEKINQKRKERIKKYSIEKIEKINLKARQKYYKNRNKICERNKILRKNRSLEQILKEKEKSRNYYQKNKQILNKKNKENRILNKENLKLKINERKRKLRKNNLSFKLRELISNRIRRTLFKNKESAWKYLYYSNKELLQYLLNHDNKEIWMVPENYGIYDPNKWRDDDASTWTWQLDHIIPHSEFPYNSMNDLNFKRAWSLLNLRPLSSKTNNIEGVNRTRHDKNLKFDEFGNPMFETEEKRKLLEKIDNWIKERENKI